MKGSRDVASSSVWVAVSKVDLPEKKYFKIGEVAHLVNVEPHVLRYWQTQFPQVRPHKSRSGHRMYRKRDVETLLAIKELLHVQRFTIAGARQALRAVVRGDTVPPVEVQSTPPAPAAPDAKPSPQPAADAPSTPPGEALVEVELVAVEDEKAAELAEGQRVLASGDRVVQVDAFAESDNGADDDAAPARPVSVLKTGRDKAGQLGFGFARSDRELLLKAREEVQQILNVLDRHTAAAPRLFG